MAFIMCAQPAGQMLYGLLFEEVSGEMPFIMIGTGAVSFLITLYARNILKELGGAGRLFFQYYEWRWREMNLLKMELKKIDIRPYCVSSLAICFSLLGLFYIFAWVPSLESGAEASEILFSSYKGIAAVGGAIALMAFQAWPLPWGFAMW